MKIKKLIYPVIMALMIFGCSSSSTEDLNDQNQNPNPDPDPDPNPIAKVTYDADIIVRINGEIVKRKKKLSKSMYGTSHKVSVEEAKYIYESGAEEVIIGNGQYGALAFSHEASKFFEDRGCTVQLLPTPEAIKKWNKSEGKLIAMFHVTC